MALRQYLVLLPLLSLVGLAGCAVETVGVELEVANVRGFLHADLIEVTAHSPRGSARDQDTCGELQIELLGGAFSAEPLRRYGSLAPCDFLGGATLADLPSSRTHYVAGLRDPTGRLIATGCTTADLSAGATRIVLTTIFTSYYTSQLAAQEPPFASIESRCGSTSEDGQP